MNKVELVEALAKKAKSTKVEAEKFVGSFVDIVKGELKKGGTLQLVGFGTFKVIKKSARKGRNPATGKEINIPAKKSPKFTPGKTLKDAVK